MASTSISPANRRKGHALTRRLSDLKAQRRKLTETQLGHALKKSRSAIAHWKVGQAWPSPIEEERLETELALPPGFFARIGAGVPYERALHETSPTVSDPITTTIEQYRQLLLLAPQDADAQRQLERVRAHLQNQIALLFDLMRRSLNTAVSVPVGAPVDGGPS